MWLTLWTVLGIAKAACPFLVVQPDDDRSVLSYMTVEEVDYGLARGSLVRKDPQVQCDSGVGVSVLSQVYFYRINGVKLAEPGSVGCVAETELGAVGDYRFMSLARPPDSTEPVMEAGLFLGALHASDVCSDVPIQFDKDAYPSQEVRWVRAIPASSWTEHLTLQDKWTERFGSVLAGRIWLSDWGYLSLPMLRYRDQSQLAEEWKREQLTTTAQRERAVSALGPSEIWLHFLGSDARFSDVWAEPDFIDRLVDLAESWQNWCVGNQIAQREHCTLQIGDLAWYNDRQPDPLGHKDHFSGRCVDLRLFRNDGSRYEAYWNRPDDRVGVEGGYDQELNQAFVHFVAERFPVSAFYFNDPEVTGVTAARGHDDHMHLCMTETGNPLDE